MSQNSTKTLMERTYKALGFQKLSSFLLFFNLAGALFAFSLSRLQYLDIDNILCGPGFSTTNRALPGECYYYQRGLGKIGMMLHLVGFLFPGLLVVFQFLPIIRHKWIQAHRVNGYLIFLLVTVGTVGTLIIVRHAFGGHLMMQFATGILTVAFIFALVTAYVSIKQLRIDRHRMWMIRAWVWASTIITTRPIVMLIVLAISADGSWSQQFPCKVVEFVVRASGAPPIQVSLAYPNCAGYMNGTEPDAWTVVKADFWARKDSALPVAAAFQASFGAAMLLSFLIHIIGVELYLYLTPGETERLRAISFQRQIEAGIRHPENGEQEEKPQDSDRVRAGES